jgi:hypothetical protein
MSLNRGTLRRIVIACSGAAVLVGCSGARDSSDSPTGPNGPSGQGSIVGGWGGTTSQGRPIHFLVTDLGIPLFMVNTSIVGTGCTNTVTSYLARTGADAPHAVTSGAFSVSTSGSSGTLAMTGSLQTSGTASGTININDTRCTGTLTGTWTATKAAGAEVNLSGTWNANFASSLVARTSGTITLTQNGAAVTGTYLLPNGAQGTITGTVSGRMATISLVQTTVGCPGTFTGYAAVMASPETLTYFYAGSDCLGAHTAGNGSATR